MNIVPLFINIFVPWGVFVVVAGVCAFSMLYRHLFWARLILIGVAIACTCCVLLAVWARRNNPEPTWYTYFAVAVTFFAIAGAVHGVTLYEEHSKHFQQLRDLKTVKDVDAGWNSGMDFLDAGIVYFAAGNQIDGTKASHFKLKSLWCVAPVSGTYGTAWPVHQSYDFWMVGKNCCSIGSADFRCGDWTSSGSVPSGIRVVDDADILYYRLAVEQAEATYGIMAKSPIFLEWVQDPVITLDIWNHRIMRSFIFGCVFAFITSCFFVFMATVRFAFIGRTADRYALTDYTGFGQGSFAHTQMGYVGGGGPVFAA